jgi:outer membrane immunogenic protein
MRKLFSAVLAASAAATPALAQDVGPRAPFTGPRAEGIVGWDRLSDGTGQDAGSSDGVVYGGQIGYDFQAGGSIIGVEAELTGSTTDTRANNLLAAGDELRIDAGRDIYVGGRLGFLAGDRAMIYAKAGYTNARINFEYATNTATFEDAVDLDGWRLGAGAELQLSPNMYLKGEYRYSNYSNIQDFDDEGVDLDRHQVLGGIGIRF